MTNTPAVPLPDLENLQSLLPRQPGPDDQPIDLFLVTSLEAAYAALPDHEAAIANWAKVHGFEAKPGQVLLLPDAHGAIIAVLVGTAVNEQGLAMPGFSLGGLPTQLPAGLYRLKSELGDGSMALCAFLLGSYHFDHYKPAKRGPVRLLCDDSARDQAILEARGVMFARDLINTPANVLGPQALEDSAQALAAAFNASISVTVGEDLLNPDNAFPMIHTVGAAANDAPRLIDIAWTNGDDETPLVTLVGKGVCFDSGGLNLKPGGSMSLMKKDMGGAGAVLGLASMIMAAKLAVRLRVLVPAVENAISAQAFRPSDVLISRKGLSVEIGNTDAEGRLVLADALALGDDDSPDLMIDMATLTGAARVALGPDLPPFFTDDETLAQEISEAAQAQDDPVWRLPLWERYEAMINGKVGDISNTGSSPLGGAITAALFLRRFVGKAKAWVHFDIYGWTPSPRPGRPEGGEAQAIRALFNLIAKRYPAKD